MTKPTPILIDTFTDNGTTITSHLSDSGTVWTSSAANTGAAWNIANDALNVNTGLDGGFSTGPINSNPDVSVIFDAGPATTQSQIGPVLGNNANLPAGSYVGLLLNGSYHLFRANGAFAALGTTSTPGNEFVATNTAADVTTYRLQRQTVAGVATISLYVNGRLVNSATDSTPLSINNAGIYVAGGVGNSADNFRVYAASAEIGVIVIGDSITAGSTTITPGYLANPPDVFFGKELSRGPSGLPVSVKNIAYPGTTSTDWVNSTNGANLGSGLTFLSAFNTRIAHIMLGTNDCKPASRISVATYLANLQSLCASLNAIGAIVFISRPPYIVAGALSGTWDGAASAQWLPDYWTAAMSLCNGSSILPGDQQFFDFTASNPSGYLGDGVHPVLAASEAMASFWAAPVLSAFSASGGTVTNGSGDFATGGSPTTTPQGVFGN